MVCGVCAIEHLPGFGFHARATQYTHNNIGVKLVGMHVDEYGPWMPYIVCCHTNTCCWPLRVCQCSDLTRVQSQDGQLVQVQILAVV
jgi:hypothetical protein